MNKKSTTIKIRPLGDRVVVKRLADEEKTETGIFIPTSAQEKAQTGEVVAIGTGRKDEKGISIPLQVKVGEVVYFGKYAGIKFGEDELILKEDEILGVIV